METPPARTAPPSSRNAEAVDWTAAARRARQLARPGPDLPEGELTEFVAELRQSAQAAPAHVGAVTALLEPAQQAGGGPIYVLDRPRWAETNLTMRRSLVGDLLPRPSSRWGARATGTQIGTVLAMLSSRVLGQYDPYTTTSDGTG